MGRSSSPTTSSATSWKNRFSDKQLERKRLSDRLNQRRTRKQTKEYVAELEKRLDLLTRGEQPTLLSQLIEENRMLRASLTRCQTKMGTVLSCTKEYLEEEDELDDGRLDAGASWQHETSHIRSRHPYSVADTTGRTTSSSLSSFQPSETSRCQVIEPVSIPVSIIFQAARLVLPTALGAAATPFTKSEWLQSIMMWKMVQPPDQDYSFLVSHFNMEKGQICLSTDEIGKSIGIPEFDDHILTCLAEGDDLIDPLIAPQHAWNREPLDTAEKQRRSIMLCAYKLISSWLKFYNSPVEAGLIFWAIYRYFMFLAFPTEGNLQKTPAWLRPTPSQVFCEHPGFVDFLIWPHLRERLSTTWDQYDEKKLMVHLIKNFEVKSEACNSINSVFPLELDPKDRSIRLKAQFRPIFENLCWFSTKADFALHFPELMSYVLPPAAAVPPILLESGFCNQELTYAAARVSSRKAENQKRPTRRGANTNQSSMSAPTQWAPTEMPSFSETWIDGSTALLADTSTTDTRPDAGHSNYHCTSPWDLISSWDLDKEGEVQSIRSSNSTGARDDFHIDNINADSPPVWNMSAGHELHADLCAAFAPFPPFCPPDICGPFGRSSRNVSTGHL